MATFLSTGSGKKQLRIVCLSDTHGFQHEYAKTLPAGDVLVVCGDFVPRECERKLDVLVADANRFFENVKDKFRHMFYIGGNHEVCLDGKSVEEVQALLPHCTYLLETSVVVDGIKFFGSPFNTCVFAGFGKFPWNLDRRWAEIPDDTDVLLTHMPPYNILDLDYKKKRPVNLLSLFRAPVGRGDGSACDVCGAAHENFYHTGCAKLRTHVLGRVRPRVHVFGHMHSSHGSVAQDGVLFVNAAMDEVPVHTVVDLFYD